MSIQICDYLRSQNTMPKLLQKCIMRFKIMKFAGIGKLVNHPDQKVIKLTMTKMIVSL